MFPYLELTYILISFLFGYLSASFPTGVAVGKLLYKKDVREYGSGNSGATNVGRVFGKKAFMIVLTIDVIKVAAPLWIVTIIIYILNQNGSPWTPTWTPWVNYAAGLGCTIGHCYPVFAKFKGGKAVSSFGAFTLGTNWILALGGILLLLLVVKIKKYVSLGSLVASAAVVLASVTLLIPGWGQIGMYPLMESGLIYTGFLFVQAMFIYWRHRENIVRLLSHKERKVTWM
jgi:acyl phosphate:glycerol-3-phosphate acyltransferase